jgi:hypothetical protein
MNYSLADNEGRSALGALLCQILYCRAEARERGLELVQYFLDMARLELEALLAAGDQEVAGR